MTPLEQAETILACMKMIVRAIEHGREHRDRHSIRIEDSLFSTEALWFARYLVTSAAIERDQVAGEFVP